jgi:hypothetical protein
MTIAGRAALVAAAGFFLAGLAQAQPASKATLTVVDHLSVGQQEETIAVYLAGFLAGTLHVDSAHPDDSFQAQVPAMPTLPFALCGKLLRRESDGTISSHPIDNGGNLTGYVGGTWAATTMGDVVFTLQDASGQGDSTVSAAPACSAAVS